MLSAVVCSSAQYCMLPKREMPVREMIIIVPRLARMTPQSRFRCFHAIGRVIRKASHQRRKASVTGGM